MVGTARFELATYGTQNRLYPLFPLRFSVKRYPKRANGINRLRAVCKMPAYSWGWSAARFLLQ